MQRLGAKVIAADSQAPDFEAANVIDGDPQTIWHTPWEGQARRFHTTWSSSSLRRLRCAGQNPAAQDLPNGRIRDYEVFVSSDGKNWGSAVKKGRCDASADYRSSSSAGPSRRSS